MNYLKIKMFFLISITNQYQNKVSSNNPELNLMLS